ncbi:MAG: DUF3237 family protein [Lachnospiraceae bacterium]|jgi:hypothetical protein|nr:DUF3237 family protein [Lachnospiraceae bacterium]
MKEVLRIQIKLDATYEVKSERGTALMILFHGDVDCENFHGKVLPGGVDTQVEYTGEKRLLSARYILEGVDREGCPCRIFIENEGRIPAEGDPLLTKPRIITDSNALKGLESADLQGQVCSEERGGIVIKIYSKGE